MAFRHIPYAGQTAPQMSELDDTFADVGAVTVTPCTATGTNTYTLTPNDNTAAVSAYSNNLRFTFIAPNTSTGLCQIQVLALGFVNLYLPGGVTQAGQGNIIANVPYDVMYNGTLNANAGGFVIISANANNFYSQTTLSCTPTLTIGAITNTYVKVTGTTNITAFDAVMPGIARTLTFGSGGSITNNSTSLIMPGGTSVSTSAGDVAIFTSEGSGNWRCSVYMIAKTFVGKQPSRTVLTSGSGTYTTPAGATRIRVRMVGGGGGGAGSGTTPSAANPGGNTTFGVSLAANGGSAGSAAGNGGPVAGGNATGGDFNLNGGAGATPSATANIPGGQGGASVFGGHGVQGSFAVQAGSNAQTNTGSGGSGASCSATTNAGGGGAAGGYLEKLIINPAATFSYAVGTAGNGGGAGTSGAAGGNGGSGLIIIDEYYD